MEETTQSLSRLIIALVVGVMLLSGCSNSADSRSASESVAEPAEGVNLMGDEGAPVADQSSGQANGSATHTDESASANSTRIDFNITVPAYRSNALQVRVIWGEKNLVAGWVVDETWTASDDFPTDTQNQLSVTFSDNNGTITLASFEAPFNTGSSATQTYNITAEQFDTDRWDDDSDGTSNIEELRAESNPELSDSETNPKPTGPASESGLTLSPVTASVEILADKTFRISWSQDDAVQYYHVLENPDGVSGFTDISGELDASTKYYDHRVASHKRVNARYMVQACNADGCVTSAQQLIESTLESAVGYFKASNADQWDLFGSTVSVSGDGKTLAVSALWDNSAATGINGNQFDTSANFAGAVFVFAYSKSGWQQQA